MSRLASDETGCSREQKGKKQTLRKTPKIQPHFQKGWDAVQNVNKNKMQYNLNLYLIKNSTKATYQMLKLRNFIVFLNTICLF